MSLAALAIHLWACLRVSLHPVQIPSYSGKEKNLWARPRRPEVAADKRTNDRKGKQATRIEEGSHKRSYRRRVARKARAAIGSTAQTVWCAVPLNLFVASQSIDFVDRMLQSSFALGG